MIRTFKIPNRTVRKRSAQRPPKLRGMFICPGTLKRNPAYIRNEGFADYFDSHETRVLDPRLLRNVHRSNGPLMHEEEDQFYFGI